MDVCVLNPERFVWPRTKVFATWKSMLAESLLDWGVEAVRHLLTIRKYLPYNRGKSRETSVRFAEVC